AAGLVARMPEPPAGLDEDVLAQQVHEVRLAGVVQAGAGGAALEDVVAQPVVPARAGVAGAAELARLPGADKAIARPGGREPPAADHPRHRPPPTAAGRAQTSSLPDRWHMSRDIKLYAVK